MSPPDTSTTFNDLCVLTAFVLTVVIVAASGIEHAFAAMSFAALSLCGFFAACVYDVLQCRAKGDSVKDRDVA